MGLGIIAGVVVEPHFAIAKRADGLAILHDIGDEHKRRVEVSAGTIAHNRLLAHGDGAKHLRRTQLLRLAKLLLGEGEHDVLVKRLAHGGGGFRIDGLGQIDAPNPRTYFRVGLFDLQIHDDHSSCCAIPSWLLWL